MLELFEKLYTEKVLNGDGFDDELNELFDKVLVEEFDDNPDRMSAFIDTIREKHDPQPQQPTNADLQNQIAELQNTIDQLMDIITS